MADAPAGEVRVVVLGRSIVRVACPPGTTLAAVLERAEVEIAGRDVHVNGRPRDLEEELAAGDLVTVIPRVRGGGAATPPHGQGRRFGPFRHRSYVVYWLGVAITSMGTWLSAVAGSIYVYQLTGSTFSVGVFNFASFIPILLFSVWGGQLSDRYDRRLITAWTHAIAMVVAAVLAAVTIAGAATELILIVAMFILNAMWAIGKPALLSLVPNIVPREDLQDAVALTSLGFMSGQIAGPLIAAAALAVSGAGLAFAINALTYVAPVVAMIALGRMGLSGREAPQGRSAAREVAESALTFLRRNTWAASLLAAVVVTSTAMEIQRTLSPAMASETLGIDEGNAGFLLASQSVGSAISLVLFVPIRRLGWARRSAMIGLVLQGAGVLGAAFAPTLPVALVGYFIIGLGFALCFPVLTAELQQATPDGLRGRVMSYHQLALLGHRPLTALAIGSVAAALGLVAGALIWLLLLPVGLFAIRTAWRRLPETTDRRPSVAMAAADVELASGSIAER